VGQDVSVFMHGGMAEFVTQDSRKGWRRAPPVAQDFVPCRYWNVPEGSELVVHASIDLHASARFGRVDAGPILPPSSASPVVSLWIQFMPDDLVDDDVRVANCAAGGNRPARRPPSFGQDRLTGASLRRKLRREPPSKTPVSSPLRAL
jgi:hypothetical protein